MSALCVTSVALAHDNRQRKREVIYQLKACDNGTTGFDHAIDFIKLSLNPDYWQPGGGFLTDQGSKVFDYEKKAAYQLLFHTKGSYCARDASAVLREIDRELAYQEMNDAWVRGGSLGKINDACTAWQNGNAKVRDDNAIDDFKDSWQKARQAGSGTPRPATFTC